MKKAILIGTLLAFLAGATASKAAWLPNHDPATNGNGKIWEEIKKDKHIVGTIDAGFGKIYGIDDYKKISADNLTLNGVPGISSSANFYKVGFTSRLGKKGIWNAFRSGMMIYVFNREGQTSEISYLSEDGKTTILQPHGAVAYGVPLSLSIRPLKYAEIKASATGLFGSSFAPYAGDPNVQGNSQPKSVYGLIGADLIIGTKQSISFRAGAGVMLEQHIEDLFKKSKSPAMNSFLEFGINYLY